MIVRFTYGYGTPLGTRRRKRAGIIGTRYATASPDCVQQTLTRPGDTEEVDLTTLTSQDIERLIRHVRAGNLLWAPLRVPTRENDYEDLSRVCATILNRREQAQQSGGDAPAQDNLLRVLNSPQEPAAAVRAADRPNAPHPRLAPAMPNMVEAAGPALEDVVAEDIDLDIPVGMRVSEPERDTVVPDIAPATPPVMVAPSGRAWSPAAIPLEGVVDDASDTPADDGAAVEDVSASSTRIARTISVEEQLRDLLAGGSTLISLRSQAIELGIPAHRVTGLTRKADIAKLIVSAREATSTE